MLGRSYYRACKWLFRCFDSPAGATLRLQEAIADETMRGSASIISILPQ